MCGRENADPHIRSSFATRLRAWVAAGGAALRLASTLAGVAKPAESQALFLGEKLAVSRRIIYNEEKSSADYSDNAEETR